MDTCPCDAADLHAQLCTGLSALRLDLTSGAVGRLLGYLALLRRWNQAYNLTAVRDPGEMVARHLLDSLAILPWVRGPRLVDIGTGPGLPGIPIAIARPDLAVTLLDSNGKKVRFCRQAAMDLGLENVTTAQARAEAHTPPDLPATITARAVADLPALVDATRRLLMGGAHLLAMKGAAPAGEIAAVRAQGLVVALHRLDVPGVSGERHLVDVSASDAAAPRRDLRAT